MGDRIVLVDKELTRLDADGDTTIEDVFDCEVFDNALIAVSDLQQDVLRPALGRQATGQMNTTRAKNALSEAKGGRTQPNKMAIAAYLAGGIARVPDDPGLSDSHQRLISLLSAAVAAAMVR